MLFAAAKGKQVLAKGFEVVEALQKTNFRTQNVVVDRLGPAPEHVEHHTGREVLNTEMDENVPLASATRRKEYVQQDIKTLLHFEEDESLNSLEDGRKSKVEFQKLQVMDISTGIVMLIGAYITILTYDLEFGNLDDDLLVKLLWAGFASTKIAIILIILRYLQKLAYLKSRTLMSQKETLFSSGEIWYLLLEIALLLLQPYPFLTGIQVKGYNGFEGTSFYYYVNDFLSMLIVIRLFLLARIMLNASIYRSSSARRLSLLYGADNNYLYATKCLMKTKPFQIVLFLFIGSIFVFGYLLRICERPLNRNPNIKIDFESYGNAIWCVILTMTTVGYGDFYARTDLGRIVSFLCCIWGVFVVSLMVVVLNNILSMNGAEEKALTVLRRLELRKTLKNEAAFVLTNMAKIGLNNRKKYKSEKLEQKNKEIGRTIKKHLNDFKLTSRQIKNFDDGTNISEEMARQFEFMRDEVKEIKQQNQDLHKVITQLTELLGTKMKSESQGSIKMPDQEDSSKHLAGPSNT